MTDGTEPQTNTEDAIRFLEWLRPGGPWPITTIVPDDGRTPTRLLHTSADVASFVEASSGRANIYYTIGVVRDGVTKKPSKPDMVSTRHLHADIDPSKDHPPADPEQWVADTLARIAECRAIPRPSYIGRSGNGLHLLWTLDHEFHLGGADAQIDEIEARTRGILLALGADKGTHNIDRLLRLPGTINLPDKKKQARGRRPQPASIIDLNDAVYSLADFPCAGPEETSRPRNGAAPTAVVEREEVQRLDQPADLDKWDVPGWIHAVIVEGTDPTNPDRWGGNRSDGVWAVTCELARRRVPPGLIVGILTDTAWGISAHVFDQKRPQDYAWRQVDKAYRAAEAEGEPFQTDKNGNRLANQHNIRLALSKMGVTVRFDLFADLPVVDGLPGFGPHLDDAATARLWLRVIEEYKIGPKKDFFWTVIEDAARRDAFHPVVEYLDSLRWDGVERLDGWMTTYLGASDSDYVRHVGALMLIAAVRRVRQPGCKYDEIVVFESEQGKSKSTALAILAVREDWFSDDLPLGADAKIVIERTRGRFIIEAAELAGMNKKGLESLKAFASRRIDRSRMAWGRLPHTAPRHFIIVGTTNDDKYLSDSTGNRRFWPVRVDEIDLDALARDRDQLWAEAAAREAAGASIRLDRALWQAAAVEQEDRRLVDPFVHVLADVFRNLNGKVLSKDVWEIIGTPVGLRTPQLEARLGSSMRELNFQHGQRRFGGNPEACYLRGTKEEQTKRIVVERQENEHGIATGPWIAFVQGDRATAPTFFDSADGSRGPDESDPY